MTEPSRADRVGTVWARRVRRAGGARCCRTGGAPLLPGEQVDDGVDVAVVLAVHLPARELVGLLGGPDRQGDLELGDPGPGVLAAARLAADPLLGVDRAALGQPQGRLELAHLALGVAEPLGHRRGEGGVLRRALHEEPAERLGLAGPVARVGAPGLRASSE